MIVYDVRIMFSEMRAEILFGFTSRAMQGSFSLKFSKLIFFFGLNAQNVHGSFVRYSCQNLPRKPPGRRRKAKERRVTSVGGKGGPGSRHADSTQRSVARHDGISGRDIPVEIK